jgi:S1-C subfamily serine protease
VFSKDVIARALDAAVSLYKPDEDSGYRMICSGVRVSSTEILTAYHCAVAEALPDNVLQIAVILDPLLTNTEIDGLAGTRVPFAQHGSEAAQWGEISRFDREHDLAVIKTAPSAQTVASIRSDRGEVGENIFAIGNPLGLEYSYSRGWVSFSCRERDAEGVCYTQADITVGPGSSGGGLYDTAGQLMGICSSGYDGLALSFFSDPLAIYHLTH